MSQRVGRDGLADPGAARGAADDPPGAVPVQPPSVRGQEHRAAREHGSRRQSIRKTADRKKVMDTSKSTDCPKCGKSTRIVKRGKIANAASRAGVYISCSACEFSEKL